MARKKRDVTKRSLYLYDEDIDTLQRFFPSTGWSVAAREILHKTCRKMEERANKEIDYNELEFADSEFPSE